MTQVLPEVNNHFNGEDWSKDTAERTTDEVIIRGEDVYLEKPKEYDEMVMIGVESEYKKFEDWLTWRVKNELIVQVYRGIETSDAQFNVTSVQAVLRKEISHQRDTHMQLAAHLDTVVIPLASMRPEPDHTEAHWIKDVPNLETRSDIHFQVSELIAGLDGLSNDALYDLAEAYIKNGHVEARGDTLKIVKQKIKDLEQIGDENKATILALQSDVAILSLQLVERDMQLLDNEVSAFVSDETYVIK
jgi:hypothetical protein